PAIPACCWNGWWWSSVDRDRFRPFRVPGFQGSGSSGSGFLRFSTISGTKNHQNPEPEGRTPEPEPEPRNLTKPPKPAKSCGGYWVLPGTIRGSKTNRFGSVTSIVARTQCVLRAPNVSTRVKFVSTPPPVERFSGLSILKCGESPCTRTTGPPNASLCCWSAVTDSANGSQS